MTDFEVPTDWFCEDCKKEIKNGRSRYCSSCQFERRSYKSYKWGKDYRKKNWKGDDLK